MEPFMFLILALVFAGLLFWIEYKRSKQPRLNGEADPRNIPLEAACQLKLSVLSRKFNKMFIINK